LAALARQTSLYKLRTLFIITLCCVGTKTYPQSSQKPSTDSIPYYLNLDDYFNLSADLETDFERFTLTGDNFTYDIRPNFDFVDKVGIDYRALSFFLSFTPSLGVNSDNTLKGKSEHTGFGFSFNTGKMINHVSYAVAKGFFLENTSDFDPDFIDGSSASILFPELEVRSFRGSHGFKLNPNFSYGAYSAQMARQTRSAGTFAPGFSYNFYRIKNGSPEGQRSKNFELLFNLPYYYTHVIDQRWYVNIGLIAGAGMTKTWLTTTINGAEFKSTISSFITRGSAIMGFGYNSKGLFCGFETKAHQRFQSQGDAVKEEINGFSFRLFVGFHIKAPRFINRTYDKFEARFLDK